MKERSVERGGLRTLLEGRDQRLLFLGKHRELGDSLLRMPERVGEERRQMNDHPLDAIRIEDIGAVLERSGEAARCLLEDQREIRLRAAGVEIDHLRGEPREIETT